MHNLKNNYIYLLKCRIIGAQRKSGNMICPKCGKENTPDASFCKNCGFSFKENCCPKCGKVNSPSSKFCQSCGASLENKKRTVNNTKENVSKVFTKIISITMIVYFSLCIIFSFCPYLKITSSYDVSYYGIWSIFNLFGYNSDNPTGLKIYEINNVTNVSVVIILVTTMLLYNLSVAALSIYGIAKEGSSLSHKKASSTDIVLIAILLASYLLQTILISSFSAKYLYGYNSVKPGFGLNVIKILGIICLLFKLTYRFVFTFDKNKGYCFASYICLAAIIFQYFRVLNDLTGFVTIIPTKSSESIKQTGFIAFFRVTMENLVNHINAGNVTLQASRLIMALSDIFMYLNFFMIVGIMVLSVLTAKTLFLEHPSKASIVYPAIIVGLTLIISFGGWFNVSFMSSEIHGCFGKDTGYLYIIGIGSILSFISALAALGAGIASYILKKKAGNNTYLL